MKKIIKNTTGIFLILAFAFINVIPAGAFYLEVPPELKNINNGKKSKTLLAQEGSLPANKGEQIPPSGPNYSQPNPGQNMYQPWQNGNMGQQNPETDKQTCNINGVEMPGRCPNTGGNQPNFNLSPNQSGQDFDSNQSNQNQFGQDEKQMEEMRKKDQERQQQDQERQLKNMQSGTRNMKTNLERLERMFIKAEKDKLSVPQEIKDKLSEAKAIIKKLSEAKSMEEMQNIDMNVLGEIMQELDNSRMEIIDKGQQLVQVKRGLQGMETGLKMFEKQVGKLSKQKISIPTEITDTIKKIKEILTAVKNAKTWDDAESAGIENLQELMQSLDEYRGQLEMISRWPQTQKDMDKELKRITQELTRDKKIVTRLKKTVDLSDAYSTFEAAVNRLKAAKEEAVQKAKDSQWEEAFDLLENDFFQQLEDAWQNSKIIQTMSNLGQFQTMYKKELNKNQQAIYKLKRKKMDTKDLENLLNQMKAKGEEAKKLVKVKPLDTDAVQDALMEIESLNQEFQSLVSELTGEEDIMPWEAGPKQFETPRMPDNWNKIMPVKPMPKNDAKEVPAPESNETIPENPLPVSENQVNS